MTASNTTPYDPQVDSLAGQRDGTDLAWDFDLPRPTLSLNLTALTGVVAADSLSRRVKALACTAPLHALESNKVRVAEGRWTRLNCWELAFVAIDAVAVAMDFDTGASYDVTVDLVAGQAARQDPNLIGDESRAAATWVVEGLISGRGGDEPFHASYGKSIRESVFRSRPGPWR